MEDTNHLYCVPPGPIHEKIVVEVRYTPKTQPLQPFTAKAASAAYVRHRREELESFVYGVDKSV